MQVWSWREAILKSNLESTTKLVLLTLSTYMNDHGNSCFPSHQTIADNASLSKRAVINHIQNAVDAGFLKKSKREVAGKIWDSNEYFASFPSEMEPRSPQNEGVNQMHYPPEIESRGEPDALEGCTTFTPGVNHVHTNSPLNSPMNSPEKNILKKSNEKSYPDGFETFFTSWPEEKRLKKDDAFKHYTAALKLIHHTQLMECAARYFQTQEVKKGFGNYPGKWLKDRRWNEVMDKSAPLSAPSLTLNDIGGDTPENRDFLAILEKLRMQVGDACFNSWFKSIRLAHKNCTVLKISVEMEFVRQRLQLHYQATIHNASTGIWPEIKTIEIVTRGK